jgi:hypothetical protein
VAGVNERLPGDIREIAARQVERLAAVVAGLSDTGLVAPTLCAGWLAAHLLAHCRQGLEEHATSCAAPAGPGDAADRDYVSYWSDAPAVAEPATYARVRYYWTAGGACATADGPRHHCAATARQAAGMSRQGPTGIFRFRGTSRRPRTSRPCGPSNG